VNRSRAESNVLDLLRRVIKRSSRAIPLDGSLAGSGLGLDSLAIVEFVVAFEKEFKVDVPESIWTDLRAITPGYFVDLLVRTG
jgi:acyl carrier protein